MKAVTGVPVLMYHRIEEAKNDWEARYSISPSNFEAHMLTLSKKGLTAITLDSLIEWIEKGTDLPEHPIVITFDDGFRSVRDHAFPVLERLNWPFTVFLVSDLIGTYDEWTRDSNPSGAVYPLLDIDEIEEIHQRGGCIQSHSRTHPSLPSLNDDQLFDQLAGSRELLTKMLNLEIKYIAYPFGHVDERVKTATKAAGYRAACSTQPGFNRTDVDRFQIRRIEIFGTDSPTMLLRKIKFGCNDGSLTHSAVYYFDRLKAHLLGTK